MLALFAAVTMAAATDSAAANPIAHLPLAARVACKAQGRYQTNWADTPAGPALARRDDRARVWRLDELPKPNMEKAVMRTVGGCAVPVVVAYSVGR